MQLVYVLLAILGGAVMPIQAGMNRELGTNVGSPFLATLNNFVGGTLLMFVVCLAAGVKWPTGAQIASAPWWSWLGGICGCTLVFAATVAVSRIGSVGVVAALLTGQLIVSLIIDQFGLLGHDVRTISPGRAVGLLLLVGGVYLITSGSPPARAPQSAAAASPNPR